MPNRILREGILTSPRMAALGWAEEVFYRRLHSVVDDFGRYFADPGLLRAACYPRQLNKVSDSDIGKWLRACVDAALVRVYPAQDGESYLVIDDFGQQVRAKKSKFPQPPSMCAADAQHVPASAPVFVSESVSESVSAKPAFRPGDGFDEFYAAYPRKVKPNDARKAWDRLKPDAELRATILKAVEAQKRTPNWLKDGGQFIPYPATWLNSGSWADELSIEVAAPSQSGGSSDYEATQRLLASKEMTPEERAKADEARRRALASLGRIAA